jgi:hypothetical protein
MRLGLLKRHLIVASLVAGWLLVGTPANAAQAAQPVSPTITLSPTAGTSGTRVTISGTGFPPGEVVALYIDSPIPFLGNPPPGSTANAQGGFSQTITWPDKNYDPSGRIKPAAIGIHNVCGSTTYPGTTQTSNVQACAVFTVQSGPTPSTSPSPSPSSSGGLVGPSPLTVGIVIGILLVLAAITALLMRQAKN